MKKLSLIFLPLLSLLLLSCGASNEPPFNVAASDSRCLNMNYGASGTPVTLCCILVTSNSSPTGTRYIYGTDFELKNGDTSAKGIGIAFEEHYTVTLTGYHLDSYHDCVKFSLDANSKTDFYVCFEGTFSQDGISLFYQGNGI